MSGNLLIQDRPSVPNMPATQITQLNPEVRNRNLLNTMFKFKKDAPLRQFIHDITKVQKNYYSLAEILTILKDVISSEKMFDERNPSVIICSKPLEAALNQRALHVTEVRDLVINQLERLADQSLRDSQQPSQRINSSQPRSQLPRGPPQTAPPTTVRTASITTNVQTNKDTKFRLKPLFLEVVRTVDEVNPKQTVFTYEEITSILSKYILSKKNAIFDTRNIKLALVENDPLGKAFGVTAFHRCQVNALLRTQLIPVHPDCPLDQLSTTTNSSPNLSVSSTERSVPVVSAPASSSSSPSLPPFPALEKAASLPASFSNRRKRTNSAEKSEEETNRQQKQQRRGDQCSVIIRRSEESESETETIYSEQGYETIKAEEENDEAASSGSDMDTTREVFEVEYDIDSGDEEERPPQAHGQGQDFSSAENSDSSADEDFRAMNPVTKVVESVYWADSEEEKEDKGEVSMKSGKGKVKCFSCKTPNQPLITHCTRCWDSRKQWAPERPRRKRRGSKRQQQQQEVKKTTPVLVAEGMDDTDGGSAVEGETERPRSDTMSSQDSGIGSQEFEMLELTETEVAAEGRPVSLDLTKLSRSISLDMSCRSSSSSSTTMDTSELSELGSIPDLKQVTKAQEMCMFCEMRPRNAIFIHGKLGHQVCCYPCAKKNWKTSPNCPICKRRVEKIIKAIQA